MRCVNTLQMTMTMIHEGEIMKQMSGGACPVTVVLSKQATHAPRLTLQTLALPGPKSPKQMRYHFRWSPSPARADVTFTDLSMTQASPRRRLFWILPLEEVSILENVRTAATGSDHVVL